MAIKPRMPSTHITAPKFNDFTKDLPHPTVQVFGSVDLATTRTTPERVVALAAMAKRMVDSLVAHIEDPDRKDVFGLGESSGELEVSINIRYRPKPAASVRT